MVADFDGEAEIGVAGSDYYTVLEADGTPLWLNGISSAITGSSVFGFDTDGSAEVVYGDEDTLWIFDGVTGKVRYSDSATGSRTQLGYPIIADVDADGSTEVVFSPNGSIPATVESNWLRWNTLRAVLRPWSESLEVRIVGEAEECSAENNTVRLTDWLCETP